MAKIWNLLTAGVTSSSLSFRVLLVGAASGLRQRTEWPSIRLGDRGLADRTSPSTPVSSQRASLKPITAIKFEP
jgi:hypothetical protein